MPIFELGELFCGPGGLAWGATNYYNGTKMYDYLAKHMRDRNAIYRITDTEVRWTKNNMTPVRTMRFDRKCRIVKGYKTTVKYEFALIL